MFIGFNRSTSSSFSSDVEQVYQSFLLKNVPHIQFKGFCYSLKSSLSQSELDESILYLNNHQQINDFTYLFVGSNLSNRDLSKLITSHVVHMLYMFEYSNLFNVDLSSVNTLNVVNMTWMFNGVKGDHLDLSSFNTSKVKKMTGMFDGCQCLSINLSSFHAKNVTDMSEMF